MLKDEGIHGNFENFSSLATLKWKFVFTNKKSENIWNKVK